MPSAVQSRVVPIQLDLFAIFDLAPDHHQSPNEGELARPLQYIEPTSPAPPSARYVAASSKGARKKATAVVSVQSTSLKFKAVWPDPKKIAFSMSSDSESAKSEIASEVSVGLGEVGIPELKGLSDPEQEVDESENEALSREMIFRSDDELEVKLAKLMFHRCTHDLNYQMKSDVQPSVQSDIFGAPPPDGKSKRWVNKVNALIWVYALNPDKVLISFDWVCEHMGHDPNKFRRIFARLASDDIKRTLKLIASTEKKYAQFCEEKVSEFLDVSGWAKV